MRCIIDYPQALANKVALIRCDLNLPLLDGQLQDDTRVRIVTPLIDFCLQNKATIVLLSHFGSPKSQDLQYSMDKISPFLPYPVQILQQPDQPPLDGQIYMLENLRFFKGEQSKDSVFAKQLATMGDIYINEAFSVCHRDHTSITVLPKLMPAYAGPELVKETTVMHHILSMKRRPIVFVVGGSKVSTKMPYLKDILGKVDYVIVGGIFANMFLKVSGYDIGPSMIDDAFMSMAQDLWDQYQDKIILPIDVVKNEHNEIADLGPETMNRIKGIIDQSRMVVWNGVLGMVEQDRYCQGTNTLVQAIRDTPHTQLIVGGGTTLVFIGKNMPQLYHVSSGGGAFLDYYAHGNLVGLSALNSSV